MANTHGTPDTLAETMAREGDLLFPAIVSTTWPVAPGGGLTLAAFPTRGYVEDGTPPRLYYVDQPAATVTVANVAGTHWVALHKDTHSAVSGWTRRAGSHYLTQQAATRPPDPPGGLLLAQVTVAGGAITAVDVSDTLRGLGTMSAQNAHAVEITGGHAVLESVTVGTLLTSGTMQAGGVVGIGGAPMATQQLTLYQRRDLNGHGLNIRAVGNDTGGFAVYFVNTSGTPVGNIMCSATATAYNTASDRRLKTALAPLADALATILALQPRTFRWRLDGSPGVGLVADEVQAVLPQAVSGTPGDVDMQGIDYSKLVPHLIAACQELAQQVQHLTARLAAVEASA